MNKIAIFVEGQTEQIFTEKLIRHLGEERKLAVQVSRFDGGSKRNSRRLIKVSGTSETDGVEYLALIFVCNQDERVESDIIDQYESLVTSGHQGILGIRDVFQKSRDGNSRDDIGKIRQGFESRLPVDPVKPVLILAIMETEAWFLAEHSHFTRIHPSLTAERIHQEFGFNPIHDDMQLREYPSKDLENIYFLETINYHKTREHVKRTVDNLDFAFVRDQLAARIPDLGTLVATIQRFLASK